MNKWEPILKTEIYSLIQDAEKELNRELFNFWKLIEVEPTKWSQKEYGNEGGGFWVVAVCGMFAIWYNDIEGGFDFSRYKIYGEINEYHSGQNSLKETLEKLLGIIKLGF